MIALIIISITLAISLGITLYKNYNLFFKHKDLKEIYEKLYNDIKDDYDRLRLRQGFYSSHINLNGETNPKYPYTVYVTELEHYTNGYSKIKIDSITVTGFSINNFDFIKRVVHEQFQPIVETSDITWLVVDNTRQDRINKLKRLIK